MAIGFGMEIIFFVLVGAHLANERYPYAALALLFAMIFGGYVGKLIEKDAIEKYKRGELTN